MKELDFEILDHTADVGIRLQRSAREDLFRDAALAMFRLILPEGEFRSTRKRVVRISGEDDGQLMVNWLSKLNFLFQTKGFVPIDIGLQIAQRRLRAEIKGDRFDPMRHRADLEIKAVTYHNLKVEESGGRFLAEILFDI